MSSLPQPQSQKTETVGTYFGGAPVDANRNFLTGMGCWFQTQDATSTTALTSPLTVTTGTVANLVIPPNAVSVTITPKTNNVQVGEVSGTTSLSQYVEIPAGTAQTFSVARQNNVYLLGVSGSSVVSFSFQTI